MNKVTIIGAGPAGLYSAYLLTKNGIKVDIYDAMSGPCKKFLIAGSSGLNLTHSETIDKFIQRYGKDANFFAPLLESFNAENLRQWCQQLEVETFVGSSGRVFPTTMTAAQMLKSWREEIENTNLATFHFNHQFIGFQDKNSKKLLFKSETEERVIDSENSLFALGGASWKKTGSDGSWLNSFKELELSTRDFLPMNCGFTRSWSTKFQTDVDNSPLKNIVISFKDRSIRTECMLTPYGIEGTGIYALSNEIRDEIISKQRAQIQIDLRPDLSLEEIQKRLAKARGKNSISNFLRKSLKINKTEINLLRDILSKEEFEDLKTLGIKLKALPIEFNGIRPMDEAISTSGGISMDEINQQLQLKKYPHLWVCGEMLDWEAPTGGYLLQACFSMAHRASLSIIAKCHNP